MNTKRKNQVGAVSILWVLVFAVLIAMAAFMIPTIMKRYMGYAVTETTKFEARLIVKNLVEAGKYLILYERAFYLNNPLVVGPAPVTNPLDCENAANRAEAMQCLWQDAPRSGDSKMGWACGFWNLNSVFKFNGYVTVGAGLGSTNENVFCPIMLRNHLMDSAELQSMLLEPYRQVGLLAYDANAKSYSLTVDMSDALDPAQQDNLSIPMYFGQQLLRDVDHSQIHASLHFEFLPNAAGYSASTAQRFVRIEARLSFPDKKFATHEIVNSETLMLTNSTPKDFAVFLPYPLASDPASTTPAMSTTNNFNTAFRRGIAGSSVHIYGRTFFNGDISVADSDELDELPVFHGAVVLTGTLRFAGQPMGPDEVTGGLTKLKEKFTKGFVSYYSAQRYLFDGNDVANGTEINGPAVDTSMRDYISSLQDPCWRSTAQVRCGHSQRDVDAFGGTAASTPNLFCIDNTPANCLPLGDAARNIDCPIPSNDHDIRVYKGGHHKIVALSGGNPNCAAIIAPAIFFEIQNGVNVYGTLFGGGIYLAGTANLYSMASVAPRVYASALPGIDDPAPATNFGKLNDSAGQTYEGVAVALPNLPQVLTLGGESQ